MQSCIIACDQRESFQKQHVLGAKLALGSGAAERVHPEVNRLEEKVMRTSLLLAAMSLLCVPLLSSDPAHAQATRTWVSGVGDDANPCSRTAPCKTFAGAISKTAASGIINCLDPGGFGAVTITKSITIDCTATLAGVLAALTNGINVNGAGANVI